MRIPLDYNEFLDFICILLYDLLKNENLLSSNERFNELRKTLIQRGTKALLFQYYMDAPGERRVEYNSRFKPIIKKEDTGTGTLFIFPYYKELVKEVAEIVSGNKLNEGEIDKIMDTLMEGK